MSNVTAASETPPPPSDNSTTLDSDEKNTLEVCLAVLLSIVIVVVIVGNTLVILAVLTTRRLRTVTNCFVMSLAVADWLVGIFVMPPAVAYTLKGTWELGWILCDIWVSLDILLCTASILSLCAISVDRYLAVTQPLHYSRNKRSKRLALTMILIVWASSALITCPPMFGWYEKGKHRNKTCRYNRNTGYVIFSAMGSFFIPMAVMLYVYVRISCVIAQRHDQLSHMDTSSKKKNKRENLREDSDIDKTSSDYEENNVRCQRYCRHSNAWNHTPELQKPSSTEPPRIAQSRSLRSNLNYSFQNPTKTPRSSFYRSSLPSRARLESLHLETLNFESASRVSSFRRETKTAQTLSIVMGGFIMCWLPFFIFYLLTPFINTNDLNTIIMQFLTWLGWINSAINPFIYAFYSPDFRLAFWRLTIKHFSKSRKMDTNLQHR